MELDPVREFADEVPVEDIEVGHEDDIPEELPEPEESEEEVPEEEVPVSEEETEAEEVGEEEEVSLKPQRKSMKSLYNEAKKEKFQQMERARQLEVMLQQQQAQINQLAWEKEEAQRYAQMEAERARETGQFGMATYDNLLNAELKIAEARKIKAIEEGDIGAQTEAEREISRIIHGLEENKNWQTQQDLAERRRQQEAQYYAQQNQYQGYPQYPQMQQPMHQPQPADMTQNYFASNPELRQFANNPQVLQSSVQFIQQNEWLNPNSTQYNPALKKKVEEYAEDYEHQMVNEGYGHLIGTPQYFEEIHKYANHLLNESTGERSLNMKSPRQPISSTRQRVGGRPMARSSNNPNSITSSEKDLVRIMRDNGLKIDEKSYLAHKAYDIQTNPQGRSIGRASTRLDMRR